MINDERSVGTKIYCVKHRFGIHNYCTPFRYTYALLSILYHLFIVQVHLIHSTVVIHARTNTRVCCTITTKESGKLLCLVGTSLALLGCEDSTSGQKAYIARGSSG